MSDLKQAAEAALKALLLLGNQEASPVVRDLRAALAAHARSTAGDVGRGPWRKGPPPSIGWWPASHSWDRWINIVKWWDGERWSEGAEALHSAAEAAVIAAKKDGFQSSIRWRERAVWWPERSLT